MFIITPSYPRRDGQSYPTPQSRFAQSFTPLIEPSVSMDNYNKQIIIWVVTFNAVASIWRSYYLRLTLYGFPETPFSNHFKTCNPKSIKPTNYKRGNIINYKMNYANKKRNAPEVCWYSTSEARINRSIIIIINYNLYYK